MITFRCCFMLFASANLALFSGCGSSRPETAPVAGKVTFGGKPVAEGSIKFWSETHGTLAVGQLDSEGNYRLTTHPNQEGARLGTHRVTIRSVRTVFVDAPSQGVSTRKKDGMKEKLVWLIPPSYDDRRASSLKAEVKSGPNTIDFNLPAENLPQ